MDEELRAARPGHVPHRLWVGHDLGKERGASGIVDEDCDCDDGNQRRQQLRATLADQRL
jgi:hypothetical protein